jgi:hypothetical protein
MARTERTTSSPEREDDRHRPRPPDGGSGGARLHCADSGAHPWANPPTCPPGQDFVNSN